MQTNAYLLFLGCLFAIKNCDKVFKRVREFRRETTSTIKIKNEIKIETLEGCQSKKVRNDKF